MRVRLAPLPTAFLLAGATLLSWWYLLFGAQAGVSVANQSGEVLRWVRVCPPGAGCVVRHTLWPHQVWRVTMPKKAVGQVKLLTPDGGTSQGRLEHGGRVQFVVTPGGALRVER